MAKAKAESVIPMERIAGHIYLMRDLNVMLDFDLAELYGVTTRRLNEQVTRNAERFPEDFMFRLSREETGALNRSQFATGSQKHRDPRYPPSPHFSSGGEAKCMRGPSVRGARRLTSGGVLEQYGEHGEQAQRSNGGPVVCFARQPMRNAG